MKAIKLTQKHKSKLSEMCKELFPNNWDDEDCYIDDDGILNMWGKSRLEKLVERRTGIDIHWFEFCMTHLISKIQNLSNKQYLINICGNINLVISDNSKKQF
jgi:hypothetical protein